MSYDILSKASVSPSKMRLQFSIWSSQVILRNTQITRNILRGFLSEVSVGLSKDVFVILPFVFMFYVIHKSHTVSWSSWTPWSACSASCGGGLQKRIRFCPRQAEHRRGCYGAGVQVRRCGLQPCFGECVESCRSLAAREAKERQTLINNMEMFNGAQRQITIDHLRNDVMQHTRTPFSTIPGSNSM